ncbi:MAG: hypothetical protein AAFR61_12685 [Bacteroidota bacterium]
MRINLSLIPKILKGIFIGLVEASPILVAEAFILPYAWTVPKEVLSGGVTLGLLVGGLMCVGVALLSIFACVVQMTSGKFTRAWFFKRLLSNIISFFYINGATLLAGFFVHSSVEAFKTVIAEPKEIGETLLILPLGVLLFEGFRIPSRWEQIGEDHAQRRWLKMLAVGQSFVVCYGWLGLTMGVLWLLHKAIPSLPELTAYHLIMMVVLILVFLLGLFILRALENWLFKQGYWPWKTHYPSVKEVLKD